MRLTSRLIPAAIVALGFVWTTPARADCPEFASSTLTSCTFTVPSSVRAPDIPRVLKKIVRPLEVDLIDLARATLAPVVSRDIKDGSVKLRDLSPGVQANLSNAPTPGALAYARVNSDGSIDPSVSKDIELVSAANGVYCLRYTAGEPHIITAMVDISGADGRKIIAAGTAVKAAIDSGGSCASETNIEVVTSTAATQSTTPAPFYVVVTV